MPVSFGAANRAVPCCPAEAVAEVCMQGHKMLKRQENVGCHWGCWAIKWIGARVGLFECKVAQETPTAALHTLLHCRSTGYTLWEAEARRSV